MIKVLLICSCFLFSIGKIKTYFPPSVQVNMSNYAYIKLEQITSEVYAAPPLVILDLPKLKNFSCFRNFRSLKYSLGIPIVFWNYSYLGKLNNMKFLISESLNVSSKVLPPTGIESFQIVWRRPDLLSNNISLDFSSYKSYLNYFLPMSHTFIMEFNSSNSGKELCIKTKNSLLFEPVQRQELMVKFKGVKTIEEKIPEVIVKLSEVTGEPIYSGCRNLYRKKCFIHLDSAKILSYKVAIYIINRQSTYNFNLQMKLYLVILSELCLNKVLYASVSDRRIVGHSDYINSQSIVCDIPNHIIQYAEDRNNDRTLFTISSLMINSSDHEFSIPILN